MGTYTIVGWACTLLGVRLDGTPGLRFDVEKAVGREFEEYEAVRFRTQVVVGMNYYVKMRVDNTDYIHIRIYVPPPRLGGSTLTAVRTGKTEQDPIEYFD
ncbi:hypothetical protein ScPMuIL_013358 [Solemya velum]